MLTILAYILLALVAAIAIIVLLASRQPDRFSTSRSRRIAASVEALYPHLNDLRRMNEWNPYALRETSGSATYSGAEQGPGARFDFAGPKSGTGHVEIVDGVPAERVGLRLVMTKPFACDNRIDLTLKPIGTQTDVTWTMSGRQPFMGKVMSVFIDCDKMVGKDFDEGLANLARIVEGKPSPALAAE